MNRYYLEMIKDALKIGLCNLPKVVEFIDLMQTGSCCHMLMITECI